MHAYKTQEDKIQSFYNGKSQTQSAGEPTLQFVDNRIEAVAQRKLQEMADNSVHVSQLKALNVMANNSSYVMKANQLNSVVDNHSAQQDHPIQKKENNTGLPDNLKIGIENLSGMSLDDVKVHRNSDKPAQLQAHAYAQGSDIHLGPGQEKHLPHEAWHIVQQKQGRVQPTKQLKSKININDNQGHRKEAETMGSSLTQLNLQNIDNTVQRQVTSKTDENNNTVYVSDLPHMIKAGKPREFKTEAEAVLREKLNQHYADDPKTHPEYPEFYRLMSDAGFKGVAIFQIWKLLLDGFSHNQQILDSQVGLSDEEKFNKENLREILNNNPYFNEVKNEMKDHLSHETAGEGGRDLALWSGGIALSKYAFEERGWAPLEKSTFTNIADTLKFHDNWKLQAPLWNILSKAFVESPSPTIHIVLRTYEDNSVLNREEIPTIKEKNPDTEIRYHAIYTHEDGKMQEIKPDLSLVKEWDGFDLMLQAITILYEKQITSPNSQTEFGKKQLEKDTDDEVRRYQLESMLDNNPAQENNPVQRKENNSGLPNNLKTGIENLSGYSMDDVKVHYNSDKPAQMQAYAYAQGSDIHLASGQERHLPHEAWHVVQQKQGRVEPTTQFKGKVKINDDSGLEREAEIMGEKAIQMQAAAPNLVLDKIQIKPKVAQRKEVEWRELAHVKPPETSISQDDKRVLPMIDTYNSTWNNLEVKYGEYNNIHIGHAFLKSTISAKREQKIEKLEEVKNLINNGITLLNQDASIEETEMEFHNSVALERTGQGLGLGALVGTALGTFLLPGAGSLAGASLGAVVGGAIGGAIGAGEDAENRKIDIEQKKAYEEEAKAKINDWYSIRSKMVDSLTDMKHEVEGQITYQRVQLGIGPVASRSVMEGASDAFDEFKESVIKNPLGTKNDAENLAENAQDFRKTVNKSTEGNIEGLIDDWSDETEKQNEDFVNENSLYIQAAAGNSITKEIPGVMAGETMVTQILKTLTQFGAAFIGPVIIAFNTAKTTYGRFKAFSEKAKAARNNNSDGVNEAVMDAYLHGRSKSIRALGDAGMQLVMAVMGLISWVLSLVPGGGQVAIAALQGIKKTYGFLRTIGHSVKAGYKILKGTRGQHRVQSAETILKKARLNVEESEESQQLIRDLDVLTLTQKVALKAAGKSDCLGEAIATQTWFDKLDRGDLNIIGVGLDTESFKKQLTSAWKSHV